MKTFEAQQELNVDREDEHSINYQCDDFDFEIFESKEMVNVSLAGKVYECFVSSLSIPFGNGLTEVVFIPFRRIK